MWDKNDKVIANMPYEMDISVDTETWPNIFEIRFNLNQRRLLFRRFKTPIDCNTQSKLSDPFSQTISM